jgi:hypothetical protein
MGDFKQDMLELLKELEWAGNLTDYDESWGVITIACPWCRNAKKDGHKENCKLAAMIRHYEVNKDENQKGI